LPRGARVPLGQPRRFGAILLTSLVALLAFVTPAIADQSAVDDMTTGGLSAMVRQSAFTEPDATLGHNIPNLLVTVGDAEVACDFLSYYQATGGLIRWGFATSEVIAEHADGLTQYYQRGVVDCQEREGVWRMERRLVWDYLGGGLGDAPDLGAEPNLLSEQPGLPLGPWGHLVSNVAIDGTPTGFLDFFTALGGLQTFGHPKSEARLDDAPGAILGIAGADPGVIRQYFQAAVFEHRPGSAEPVQLRFLGDAARDVRYPFGSHQVFQSFRSARPLRHGQTFVPEGTSVRDALVALYRAADGDNWNNNENWLSDAPLGEWYGVTTDDNGRVIKVSLSQNQLNGSIPVQIGRLTDLEDLNFWGNQLRGEIPTEIGNLRNLKALSFAVNQLSGGVPPELGNLTNLEDLRLRLNQLSGPIPPVLGNLTELTVLDLAFNQLSGGIPPELGNLTKLTRLVLWVNRLEGEIPSELGNLTNLSLLDVDYNRLSGEIPAELGNLVNLEELWMHNNRLSGEIPAELGNLVNLQWLNLLNNELTGPLPPELSNLTNLRKLELVGNAFTGGCIPAGWQEIADHDLSELDLPFCEAEEASPAQA